MASGDITMGEKWRMQLHNDKGPRCHGCTERYAGCHSECEDYKEWCRMHSEKRQELAKATQMENIIADTYRRSVVCKHWDRKKRR
jgi:hypothetical protein